MLNVKGRWLLHLWSYNAVFWPVQRVFSHKQTPGGFWVFIGNLPAPKDSESCHASQAVDHRQLVTAQELVPDLKCAVMNISASVMLPNSVMAACNFWLQPSKMLLLGTENSLTCELSLEHCGPFLKVLLEDKEKCLYCEILDENGLNKTKHTRSENWRNFKAKLPKYRQHNINDKVSCSINQQQPERISRLCQVPGAYYLLHVLPKLTCDYIFAKFSKESAPDHAQNYQVLRSEQPGANDKCDVEDIQAPFSVVASLKLLSA
ncbi:hypothetical protein Anapl_13392 [Anas platyrhynchos]|uniref:Uncharacterized protein n=1 Tax=Anas platyrhynchos TaxID=8839 RepID=R0L1D7_ANAPL|nr:hypothetical protein Anapl_13392 [Anas platyrhynchos]